MVEVEQSLYTIAHCTLHTCPPPQPRSEITLHIPTDWSAPTGPPLPGEVGSIAMATTAEATTEGENQEGSQECRDERDELLKHIRENSLTVEGMCVCVCVCVCVGGWVGGWVGFCVDGCCGCGGWVFVLGCGGWVFMCVCVYVFMCVWGVWGCFHVLGVGVGLGVCLFVCTHLCAHQPLQSAKS